jgi:uncharacterized protein YecE (DUF72 family)
LAKARIGVSGWSYDNWQGHFWPNDLPRKRRLEYIGENYDSVEANGSFYSMLTAKTYRSWYEQTPRGFVFALKGSRFISHNKRLKDEVGPVANFFASGVLALEEKLGPIVWQLPARMHFDADRLRRFFDLLPRNTEDVARIAGRHDARVKDPLTSTARKRPVRYALEARHESFFTDEAIRILRDARVALAVSDAGGWPLVEEVTAGFVYVRLHGSPETYRSRYEDEALDAWASKIRAWLAGREAANVKRATDRPLPRRKAFDVYVYFDNDGWCHAPHDALRLKRRLGV